MSSHYDIVESIKASIRENNLEGFFNGLSSAILDLIEESKISGNLELVETLTQVLAQVENVDTFYQE